MTCKLLNFLEYRTFVFSDMILPRVMGEILLKDEENSYSETNVILFNKSSEVDPLTTFKINFKNGFPSKNLSKLHLVQ